MRHAALGLLAVLACAARPSAPTQRAAPPVPPEAAPPLAVAAHEPEPAVTDASVRGESIEQRAAIREILRAPGLAKWRGIYRGGGPVRLRLDGPVVDTYVGPGDEMRFDVVESRDDRARVLWTLSGITLLAWVDHADFVPQPQEQLVLAPAPGHVPEPGMGRIEIAPGERVHVLRTKGDWHEVELPLRERRGWLPVAAFAPVFPKGGFALQTQSQSGIARRRTRVLDRPGGKTIWRTAGEFETEVDIVRETKSWLEIMIVQPCDATIRITGFVRRSEVTGVTPQSSRGFGCGEVRMGMGRKVTDDAIDVTLPEGTELFDDVGQLVGLAGKSNVLRRTPAGALQVTSRWGPIPVVAEVEATPLPPT